MKINECNLYDTLQSFNNLIINNEFVTDRTGVKTVEILGPSIKLDSSQKLLDFGIKKSNEKYIEEELKWYLSQDLNVKEIGKTAALWTKICSKDGKVNSNYGHMIYSEQNHNQYRNCLNELKTNPLSRRAMMIYTRPSMHIDYNRNGMNDFVCTNNVQCFIRNNQLIYLINQRSCDFIYGFFNDFAWHCYVYEQMMKDLLIHNKDIMPGHIIYQFGSLHVYEKHFDLVQKMFLYVDDND